MIPQEYHGREQTYFKHRILYEYLISWAHKLAIAGSRHQDRTKLWYVDCFSGPWEAQASDLSDTSVHIGLSVLHEARTNLLIRGIDVEMGAVFVEKGAAAFTALERLVAERADGIDAHTLHGEFGDRIGDIDRLVGNDPAFLLVDPTGWKGAAMQFIAPLVRRGRRDVLVNVMFEHINRFKDDEREFIRSQMKDFFGLSDDDIEAGLNEAELIKFYRDRLSSYCSLEFVADIAVPHPSAVKTKFRLVVGGHHHAVIHLFRNVERKIMGREAATVQVEARERQREARTGQLSLIAPSPPSESPQYAAQREQGRVDAKRMVIRLLQSRPTMFGEIWPLVLQECHITLADLKTVVMDDLRSVVFVPLQGLEKKVKDDHVLRLI